MSYKVSDILDPTPISGNTLVKNFVNRCKENLDAKKNQKETQNLITSLNSITDEIFCFESNDNGNKQICLSRKFSEKNVKPSVDNKTTIAKNNLKGCFDILPTPGDVLAARPQGPKINEGFTEESILLGKNQRISLGKRFGFGDIKSDGFQYAIYDKNLSLNQL